MVNNVYFRIADHILLIKVPIELSVLDFLPSFEDFIIEGTTEKPVIQVELTFEDVPELAEERKLLSDTSVIWGEGFAFEEYDNGYITTLNNLLIGSKIVMLSSKEFEVSTIYLDRNIQNQVFSLNWFIMVAFGQGVLPYKTVMIHASTVERNNEEAYAFLGVSGTGKSTHSQLWLKYLQDFTLLNDDNPAIRIFADNKVYIYGTPWSGKTVCYRNLKVQLNGFVRLRQADFNKFQLQENTNSFIYLLPSCTAIRWNKKLFNHMVDSLESIIKVVPVGTMDCRIDEEAAYYCYEGIKLKN